jgi:transglutaminase-like putative cysteine protease
LTYRVRIEHVSRYRYAAVVHSSYNETRLTPLTTPWQLVLDSNVSVLPAAPIYGYVDYWGSVVQAFDLPTPHHEMVITARSVVETFPFGSSASLATPLPGFESNASGSTQPGWDELADPETRDRFTEYLAPTAQVSQDERIDGVAAELSESGRGRVAPIEAAQRAVNWVHEQLTYLPGTTGVHTSAVEAWEGGAGVCQDFAHLTLSVLRAMGIPARYCSGYAHPHGSHAWIEYWAGDWFPVDPTAGQSVGEHHVLVARGRDYSDVPPVKGVFHGGPTAGLDVSVALTRLA